MKYVYVYLDPRKPGIYKYQGFTFDYEPFYIGMGSGYRYKAHLYGFTGNTYLHAKINKIRTMGLDPVILKLAENIHKDKACSMEILLIKSIGRLNNGPLVNMTDGGETSERLGKSWTSEQREKIMTKRKIKQPRTGMTNSPEMRMKQSLSKKDKKFTEAHKEKLSKIKNKIVIEIINGEIINKYDSVALLMESKGFSNVIYKYIRSEKPYFGSIYKYLTNTNAV